MICKGKVIDHERLQIYSSLPRDILFGTQVELRVVLPEMPVIKEERLSRAAQSFLNKIRNAGELGTPDEPDKLSHSKLLEERMDEKF